MDEQYEYRTGQTQPRKSNRGLIAVLLIAVIILGGLVSALSFMNIHLFRMLQDKEEKAPLSFSVGEAAPVSEDSLVWEGMALQEPDPVYEKLYALPEGLYIARVAPDSQAEGLGVEPGDVLLAVGQTPVSSPEDLQKALDANRHLKRLPVTLCREEKQFCLVFTDFK